MNNKGFAITSILYGLLVMFLLIIMGTLAMLSNQKRLMEELIDADNGARDIARLETIEIESFPFTTAKRALYSHNGCKKYYGAGVNLVYENFTGDCIQ